MLNYAWREISRRKGRSIAAICSYSLATVIFSVLISLVKYSEINQYKTLYDTGTHFIAFNPACCNLPLLKDEAHEGFWANGSRSAVMPMNLIDSIKMLPTVRDVSPVLMFRFKDSTNNGILLSGFYSENNISVANTTCASTDLIEGRFITPQDTNAVLVEESFAQSRQIRIGNSLSIAELPLSVVGIVNAGIRPVKSDVYIQFKQAERIISRRTWNPLNNEMNIILVESANAEVHKQAVENVKKILGKNNVVSSYACHNPASEAININRQLLKFITIFIIIFIAFHIVRTHYASIVERKREIGIFQSMGWSRKRIVSAVAYELILQALLGGIAGIYISGIYHLTIPSFKLTKHILCAFDSFGNTILGLGLVIVLASSSAVGLAFYIVRFQPIQNIRTE